MTVIVLPRSRTISAKTIEASDFEKMRQHIIGSFVISGIECRQASLRDARVSVGRAYINGLYIEVTTEETLSIPINSTRYIRLQLTRDSRGEVQEADITVTNTDTVHADQLVLARVVTNSRSITSVDNNHHDIRNVFILGANAKRILDSNTGSNSNPPSLSIDTTDNDVLKLSPKQESTSGVDGDLQIFPGSQNNAAAYGTVETLSFPLGDESTVLTVGTKYTWRPMYDIKFVDARGQCTVAPTGSAIQFDVTKNGTTIFTTRPSINANAFHGSIIKNFAAFTADAGDRLDFRVHSADSSGTCAGGKIDLRFYYLNKD